MNSYKPTIGIEVHLELKSNSKVFSPSKNNYKSPQNENINEIDLAYPGVLPTVNEEVVNKAIRACLGLNMEISKKMHFDRKNYYYPDLPKGYQITQMETPIGRNGYLEIEVEGKKKKIGIERIHIEEDTAKSMHHDGKTLLNYNRCGVPLIEIVSKPDMHSIEDAISYAEALRELMLYLDVSDAKIEEGSIRFDVNISVSRDNTLGVRSEIKNIGSISNIGKAIEYEIKRQSSLLEESKTLTADTRRYDESKGQTIFMRKKEPDTDYRYFPEPDIPYLYVTDDMISSINRDLPLLPGARKAIYEEKGISEINIEKLLAHKSLSDYLNLFLDENIDFTIASNILLGDISSYLNKNYTDIFSLGLTKDRFITLVNALKTNKISSKIFKAILDDYLSTDKTLDNLLEVKGLVQVSDKGEIEKFINEVLSKYEDSVTDYKNGKTGVYKFLMGMVMKESKGRVDPRLAGEILKDILDK